HSRHHHDLPAAGHPWPAGRGESLKMADGARSSALHGDLARALREAGVAALIALALFVPLIGFRTVQNIRNELVLETRWPLLCAVVLIIAVGRFLQALVIDPWRARRARAPRRETADGWFT